jgi:uncharacterized protein YggL (DUF469 family)
LELFSFSTQLQKLLICAPHALSSDEQLLVIGDDTNFLTNTGNNMSEKTTRNRRIRKKLHLDEWAILGFEFSCKLALASEAEYEAFFSSFADLVKAEHMYITLDSDSESFEGFVTSADRYGDATEENRVAIEALLNSHAIVSEVKVGALIDAFYGI